MFIESPQFTVSMSTVLAANCRSCILAAYDTAEYRIVSPTRDELYRNTHKVRPIGSGRAFLGLAGAIPTDEGGVERVFSDFDAALNTNHQPILHLLNAEIYRRRSRLIDFLERKIRPSNPRLADECLDSVGISYLVGFIDAGQFRLGVSEKLGETELREVNCYGIGRGAYEEVRDLLKGNYSRHISEPEVLELLQEALTLSKRLSQTRESTGCFINGTGIRRFSYDGLSRLCFQEALQVKALFF